MGLMGFIKKTVRETATRISPELNTRLCYRVMFGENINLTNPLTLSEKNSWLKLNVYNKSEKVKQLADKYRVREYIKEKGLEDTLTRLYAVYEKPADVEWEKLPDKFVMKLNVGSKCNLICKDKAGLDTKKAAKEINRWFDEKTLSEFYLAYAEMQYKDVKPLILVEELLEDKTQKGGLTDYKFFCYDGKCDYVMVCTDRFSKDGTKFFFYDKNWNFYPWDKNSKMQGNPNLLKPNKLEKAFACVKKLSEGFPFVRVDLYIVNDKVYFGEMTFTGNGGMDAGIEEDAQVMMGNKIELPLRNKK